VSEITPKLGKDKSYVDSIWPVVGCLTEIEDALDKRFTWLQQDDPFRFHIACSLIGHEEVRKLLESGELLSIASEDSREINAFLKEYGSGQSIHDFEPFASEDEYRVATASRLCCQTRWEGMETSIIDEGGDRYLGFWVEASLRHRGGPYNIGPEWWIEITGTEFDILIWEPDLLSRLGNKTDGEIIDVSVPCASIACDNDMSWLVGKNGNFMGPVKTLSGRMFGLEGMNRIEIEQAVQTSMFDMDDTGASVRAVAAVQFCLGTGCCSLPRKRHVIVDRPFHMHAIRGKMPQALMYGWLAQDSWRAYDEG